MDFTNKVALITGSSRGIGLATAKELASHGCNIVINYCNQEASAKEAKRWIEDHYSVKVLVVKADVSNEIEVKDMVEKVNEEFGRIDILVNNAGISIDTLFEDKTKENFMKILEVNLVGSFLVSREVGKNMMERKQGRIINISSTNGIDTGYPESIDYDASKAGLISLTKNLSLQFAPYVTVNTVCSGWVTTEMNQELSFEQIEKEKTKILLNRFATPEEIAKVITFLASEESSYINASTIRVDGGVKY